MGCFGPNQQQFQKRKIQRLLEAGEKFGEKTKKYLISSTAVKITNFKLIWPIESVRQLYNFTKIEN